jgi:hypothetical protein
MKTRPSRFACYGGQADDDRDKDRDNDQSIPASPSNHFSLTERAA